MLFVWICSNIIIKEISSNKYTYKEIIELFNFFLEESYSIIYENDIFVYVSNGVKDIPTSEKETIERNFIKQTIMLMGPKNQKLIIDFLGNKESFIAYMIRFLRKKINNDNIIRIINNK